MRHCPALLTNTVSTRRITASLMNILYHYHRRKM